jgi:lysophospholipase L1-like esterase
VNRGFSGYNTRYARRMLPAIFPAGAPRFAVSTIFFGANDATDAAVSPCQAVPVAEYEENVAAAAEAAAAASELVVVFSPPPVDSARWPDRCNAAVRSFTEAAARAVASVSAKAPAATDGGAAAGAVVHVNLWQLFSEAAPAVPAASAVNGASDAAAPADSWMRLLNDGLHLSAEGNALVAQALLAAIATHAPHLVPDALPWDFPYWKDVDNSSVDAAAECFSAAALAKMRAAPPPGPASA